MQKYETNIVAKFEKVSYEEFKKSWMQGDMAYLDEEEIKEIYENIQLPQRSTKRSSGYDFFYPGKKPVVLMGRTSVVIPTGIRCVFFKDCYDLSIYPRSSMGFKYRLSLDNTVGIIDNDYFEAENEGHIKIKVSYDRDDIEYVIINKGDKFAQGIIREFFLAEGDDAVEKENRTGGMGSTGN